ncbi:IS5 family transposase [Streptomyces sp. NPDC029554]|uniref:IS5 family transposase n=1 Tax=Streptomyces sp. NPDC029554 TaxID=3155126 RepID=UPI0033E1DA51
MVDHGGVIRRHELTDQEWELLAPLIPRVATGRPRVSDRQVINGMVYKIRTGISWRDLPERYGPWQTVYTRFRRCALDGVFARALQQIQAGADAAGDIDWLVQIDSTIVRAHQHAAATGRKGAPAAGRTGRSRPRPIPRRTDHQNPSRLRRQGPPARDPGDTRPTQRQHLRATPSGAHPCPAHRAGPTTLQARPGRRRQGLQHPRLPRLPAQTRHRPHHPREDRPAATPANRGRRGGRPPTFNRQIYRQRNVIERCFNRLKAFRGIATRYEKTATSYEAAVTLASVLLWARSV